MLWESKINKYRYSKEVRDSERSLSEAGKHKLWMPPLHWDVTKPQSPRSWGQDARLTLLLVLSLSATGRYQRWHPGLRDFTSEPVYLA